MGQRDPDTGVLEPDDAGPDTGRSECADDDQLDTLGPENACDSVEVHDNGEPLGIPELDEDGDD